MYLHFCLPNIPSWRTKEKLRLSPYLQIGLNAAVSVSDTGLCTINDLRIGVSHPLKTYSSGQNFPLFIEAKTTLTYSQTPNQRLFKNHSSSSRITNKIFLSALTSYTYTAYACHLSCCPPDFVMSGDCHGLA
jgi:hypothetical protein